MKADEMSALRNLMLLIAAFILLTIFLGVSGKFSILSASGFSEFTKINVYDDVCILHEGGRSCRAASPRCRAVSLAVPMLTVMI